MALVESQTSQDGPLSYPYKSIAERAVAYALAQRDAGGIWRAGETRGAPDLAATGLTLMALAIAKSHGIEVKSELVLPGLALCEGYLTGGARLADRGAPTDEATFPATSPRSLTALALIARSLWNGSGVTLGKLDEDALNRLAAEPLTADDRDQTGFFLSALALGRAAGDRWIEFTKKMKPLIIDTQVKDGPTRGSWPAVDPFARIGGTYYCSGVMTLALELYYRYPRVVGMPGDVAK